MKPDDGGPAYPSNFIDDKALGGYRDNEGMTMLDKAALVAFPEKLRVHSSDEDAAKHAYHAGEMFIAEKRRREE